MHDSEMVLTCAIPALYTELQMRKIFIFRYGNFKRIKYAAKICLKHNKKLGKISWVKRNQPDATYFIILFNAQHVSDVNTSILRSLRLIRSYFMGCVWFGVCWRSISVWLWWCGVFMQSEALRNANTHRTRYNPWNNYELVASSWGWTY